MSTNSNTVINHIQRKQPIKAANTIKTILQDKLKSRIESMKSSVMAKFFNEDKKEDEDLSEGGLFPDLVPLDEIITDITPGRVTDDNPKLQEYLKDAKKATEYYNTEMAKLFPGFIVRSGANKTLGWSVNYYFAATKNHTDLGFLNAYSNMKFMIHLQDSPTKLVDKFEIELLSMDYRVKKDGLKYRKIKGKNILDATKKLVAWFKKNETLIKTGYADNTNESRIMSEQYTEKDLEKVSKGQSVSFNIDSLDGGKGNVYFDKPTGKILLNAVKANDQWKKKILKALNSSELEVLELVTKLTTTGKL